MSSERGAILPSSCTMRSSCEIEECAPEAGATWQFPLHAWTIGMAIDAERDSASLERLPAKAGRLLFRLKVGLRLKPPEAAPAEEPAQGSVGAVILNPSSS